MRRVGPARRAGVAAPLRGASGIPDLAAVSGGRDPDHAGGKRGFFSVSSFDVIAAHECKSLVPFPELLVSFIGIVIAGHAWLEPANMLSQIDPLGLHLAPTLFVGGSAKPMQRRMIAAIEKKFPVNIIPGLHQGTWGLTSGVRNVSILRTP
jgi:hypothetical protein